jgi:hypothetical protein
MIREKVMERLEETPAMVSTSGAMKLTPTIGQIKK